jgi:hypothetical protein
MPVSTPEGQRQEEVRASVQHRKEEEEEEEEEEVDAAMLPFSRYTLILLDCLMYHRSIPSPTRERRRIGVSVGTHSCVIDNK